MALRAPGPDRSRTPAWCSTARCAPKILQRDPFARYPPCEKLLGDLSGAFSRRISLHHRLVYQVLEDKKPVKILRMWTRYE